MARRVRRLLILVPVVAVGAFLAWRLTRPPLVHVAAVGRGPAVETVYASGTVEADPRVEVRAKVGGTLAEVRVDAGAAVRAGDLLARVDNPQLRYEWQRSEADLQAARARVSGSSPQLAQAEAQLRAADAALAQAQKDLADAERLAAAGAAPKNEVEARRSAVDRARADRDAAAARLKALRTDLEAERRRLDAVAGAATAQVSDTEVRAPIEGVVIRRYVDQGELVTAGQRLFVVGDTSRLVLEVAVDEADVGGLRVGQPASATLYAYPGRAFAGRVLEIAPDADRQSRTFLTRIALDEPPPGLRSGMSAEVNVVLGRIDDAVLVPSAAVRGDRVWVVEGGRARERRVELGVRELGWHQVLSGLEPGDQVIVGGARPESDGARVRVRVVGP